jgi:hypothetical protein
VEWFWNNKKTMTSNTAPPHHFGVVLQAKQNDDE